MLRPSFGNAIDRAAKHAICVWVVSCSRRMTDCFWPTSAHHDRQLSANSRPPNGRPIFLINHQHPGLNIGQAQHCA